MSFEQLAIQNSRESLLPFCLTYDKNYTVNWHHRELAKALEKVESGEIKRLIIEMPPRHGKQIAHNTLVPTPDGFKKHGDLRVGDYVLGGDGKPVKVIAVSEESKSDLEVTFTDGTKIIAHRKHEWEVYERTTRKWRILETEEMLEKGVWTGVKGKRGGRAKFQIRQTKASYPKQKTIVDPYTLGVWLGDGTTGKPTFTLCPTDWEEIVENIPYECTNVCWHNKTGVPSPSYYKTNLTKDLKQIGVYKNKHIPDNYLFNSEEKRRELLAGLVDTDGSVDKTGRVTFSNTNKKIIDSVATLVSSLGYRTYVCEYEPCVSSSGIIGKKKVYTVGFSVHDGKKVSKLTRKQINNKPIYRKRAIASIRKCKPRKSRCIQIENKDGIYLVTNRFIPTHNSQLASIYFPAWYLGRNPDKEIITCSYSGDLAVDFGGKTRDVIDDPQYQGIFDLKLKQDSKSKNKWQTNNGGSYTSVGIGGAITGRGANILIIDDPLKNREEAESKVIRDKVWSWYTSTAYTRLEKDASVIVIMTRWHMDDLVGRLLEADKKDEWHRVTFPAIALEDTKYREKGKALWPDKYDLDTLADTKEVIGVYDWHALYQQQPIAAETQEFKPNWFKYYEDKDLEAKDLYIYVTVDLAISDKETADNTSIQVVGKGPTRPEWYKLEEMTGKLNPGEVIDYLFHLKNKYGYKLMKVGIETVAYQKALLFFLEEEMRKRQVYFDIVELKAKGAKEIRIRGLVPLYKMGLIYHRRTDLALEEELLTFPAGKHDDRIDALAYMLQVMTQTKKHRGAKQYKPNVSVYK